ncbi:MAG: helix-turn-helix transcriptional regulator [Agathobacter sp.]|nr:helix-turn-helix transcriptional regulator [Agathobacter sp.]
MISINTVCQNVRHKGNFEIYRPEGSGDNLLVIFKTSAVLVQKGEEVIVSPDNLILYSKGTPQHYKTLCGSYVNHFVHFNVDDTELMNRLKTDTLITSADIPAIEALLAILCRENVADSPNKEHYENMLMQMILIKISECCENPNDVKRHISDLEILRANIYSNAGNYNNIYQLADKMNLSPSYFQALYKKNFGISCYEDILSAKIRTGQYYLSTTDIAVKEISNLCGYGNEISFMKIFKKRTGLTPSEYREISRNDISN